MAQYSVTVKGESLAANTAETIAQVVASATKSLRIVRWSVSFNGTTATDVPVQVDIGRPTGQGTSSAFAPLKMDPSSDAPLATARTAHTAEPTWGDVLESFYVTPYGGLLSFQYAEDERPVVPPSGRFGIRCHAIAAVNVDATIVFEE